jgi:DOPA 4,5-dioxygenase
VTAAPRRPENAYERYHAHVYFDADTVAQARALCRRVADECSVVMGRVHERLVGPHPRWSCQLAFASEQFDGVIARLDAERQGLTVLVHGLTGDDYADHTAHAMWLGDAAVLDLSAFEPTRHSDQTAPRLPHERDDRGEASDEVCPGTPRDQAPGGEHDPPAPGAPPRPSRRTG